MKRIILNIIIASALIFSATNVYADGDKDKKESSKKSTVAEMKAEAEMKIENWMTELNLFSSSKDAFIEESLELEEWMSEEFSINSEETFLEAEMQIESWMTKSFNSTEEEVFEEEELKFEPWMFSMQ